jgi:hypothetical protein
VQRKQKRWLGILMHPHGSLILHWAADKDYIHDVAKRTLMVSGNIHFLYKNNHNLFRTGKIWQNSTVNEILTAVGDYPATNSTQWIQRETIAEWRYTMCTLILG